MSRNNHSDKQYKANVKKRCSTPSMLSISYVKIETKILALISAECMSNIRGSWPHQICTNCGLNITREGTGLGVVSTMFRSVVSDNIWGPFLGCTSSHECQFLSHNLPMFVSEYLLWDYFEVRAEGMRSMTMNE